MEYEAGEARGDQMAACKCYIAMLEMDDHLQALNIEERQVMMETTKALEDVSLDDRHLDQTTRIGTQSSLLVHKELTLFIRNNLDVFAWSHEDMPGIDSSTMVHCLNVSPSFPPILQKKRVFAQERDNVIAEKVRKLLEACFYHQRGILPQVVGQRGNGQKGKQQVENVCGPYQPKQSLPE